MNTYIFIVLALVVLQSHSQSLDLISFGDIVEIVKDGNAQKQFQASTHMDCGMPELFVLPDRNHQSYTLVSIDLTIISVEGLWLALSDVDLACENNNCRASYSHQCTVEHEINRIKITTTQLGAVQYLVDCQPDQFYKPFQWGLFLLICLAALTLTLSSAYSRAWSYEGAGFVLNNSHILVFNALLVITIVVGYAWPGGVSLGAKIIGSIVGAAGVGVCLSQLLWLTKNKRLREPIFSKIRRIDIISYSIGLLSIPIYWLSNGHWVINDVMAICATVALMKLLKLQSLATGTLLLMSLLIVESAVGVAIHYIFKLSYNNYIINILQNPAIIVMPSLTKELYRQCAWLPITCVLFPGLLLSYLRRFDRSRSTHLYFYIGLTSFYIGSLLWMVVDMETVHSLPFSIFSEPVTLLILCLHSYRRNEFRVLWRGVFHDEELMEGEYTKSVVKQTEIVTPSAYANLTDNLRITHETEPSDQYSLLSD